MFARSLVACGSLPLLIIFLIPGCRCFSPRLVAPSSSSSSLFSSRPDSREALLSDFYVATNGIFRNLTIGPVREYAAIKDDDDESIVDDAPPFGSRSLDDYVGLLTTPPRIPMVPRPVFTTVIFTLATGVLYYGWYKFSVEEELFNIELRSTGVVRGPGGYGTIVPFSLLFLAGLSASAASSALDSEALAYLSKLSIGLGSSWVLVGQYGLYQRVNDLYVERGAEPPLHCWWCFLPPPLDVVVGLRQVHFLAKHASAVRNVEWRDDVIAENLFPFISSPRFTLREFVTQPRRWFWFTKNFKDFDIFNKSG